MTETDLGGEDYLISNTSRLHPFSDNLLGTPILAIKRDYVRYIHLI
jgi:hypothetical protein